MVGLFDVYIPTNQQIQKGLKMTIKPLILILLSMSLTACLVPPTRVDNPREYSEEVESQAAKPLIGEVSAAEIGDNLFREYKKVTTTTYTAILDEDAESNMDLGHKLRLPKNTKKNLEKHPNKNWKVICFDFITVDVSNPAHACLADSDNDGYFDKSMFKNRDIYFPLIKKVKYSLQPHKSTANTRYSFERYVLYQGISKGEIKVSFREFIDGMARPAFTQDITYELKSNNTATIAFKGLRIKVLNATGANIKYVIEKPFSDN